MRLLTEYKSIAATTLAAVSSFGLDKEATEHAYNMFSPSPQPPHTADTYADVLAMETSRKSKRSKRRNKHK